MLWTDGIPPPSPTFCVAVLTPQHGDIRRQGAERWLGHEGEGLLNGISASIPGSPRQITHPFYQIPQGLDLGVPKFQNCEKKVPVV